MKSIDTLLKNYQKSLTLKRKWEGIYRPVYEYMMPLRYEQGDKNGIEIYSSLGEQVADRFVQKLQALLTPIATDWISLEAGYTFKKMGTDLTEVNQALSDVANLLNVYKDTSNCDTVLSEFYYDLIAGTACLLISEGTQENPLRFSVVPMSQFSFSEGAFSEVAEVFRTLKMSPELIPVTWRDAVVPEKIKSEEKERELLECTYYDYQENIWFYNVIDLQEKKILVKRTYQTNPFIIVRWSKCAGEIYGRGAGLKVVQDVQTLNKITEYSLRALAFTIPVFCASQDGDYDVDEFVFEPGAINPVPSTATNNPTITQLGVNQSPALQNYQMERLEMEIKKNMFDTTIPNDPSREMTATEINARMNDLQANMTTAFGRLIHEFLYPMIRRMAEILQKFGYLSNEIDVRLFNGFGYKIKVSLLPHNTQKQLQINQMLTALQTLMNFDPGKQFASKVIDMTHLAPYLMAQMGMPGGFIRTPEVIQNMIQEEAELAVRLAEESHAG